MNIKYKTTTALLQGSSLLKESHKIEELFKYKERKISVHSTVEK